MGWAIFRASWLAASIGAMLICGAALGQEQLAGGDVEVKYSKFNVEFDSIKTDAKYYAGKDYVIKTFPDEVGGLMFSRMPFNNRSAVSIDATKGVTVYLLLGGGPMAGKCRQEAADAGWIKAGEVVLWDGKSNTPLLLFKLVTSKSLHVALSEGGYYGIGVASRKLSTPISGREKKPDQPTPETTIHADAAPDTAPSAGPTTRVANQQTTIKALEIYELPTGLMLGQTSEATLTVVRGVSPQLISARFVTPVGDQMCLARDEALRFIHLTYPNWYAAKAEITFEDKYVAHDGGSIGAAIGTMILSVIQGFEIDPNIAITGDISANGKVRAIGGLSAKIRGATESKCTLVIVPMDNYGQLVDMVTYSGAATVSNVQIIGISNLDEAAATARIDRSNEMKKAIDLFSEVQGGIKKSPGYLKTQEAKDKLIKVLDLAPQHLSAKLLLGVARGLQPSKLSATASQYYTFLAVRSMLSVLMEREITQGSGEVPSSAVQSGLTDLRKLRPLADLHVQPLIDAWSAFIRAWNAQQQGAGSKQAVANQRQALLDEMAKEQADADLMQKMLKEGM